MSIGIQEIFDRLELVVREREYVLEELGRVGQWENLIVELPALVVTAMESLLIGHRRPRYQLTGRERYVGVLVTGWFGTIEDYVLLEAYLRAFGIYVVYPKELYRNWWSWKEMPRMVSDTAKQVKDRTGRTAFFLTHSRGGDDAALVMDNYDHDDINQIISICSPQRGSSLRALHVGVSMCNSDPGNPPSEQLLESKDLLSRTCIIASDHDRIVPPHEAISIGARNIIKVNDAAWWSKYDHRQGHIRLPFHAREHIVRIIKGEEQDQAAA
ncbi:MAG: hypothetical protein HY470_01090 [Candidatus Ryanbacteria bacterium]|nr:hypothetical protein [Candidatus Ryanbacteria bacterium]